MKRKWPHTGAVLAGGASKRMGVSKVDLALPSGQTMLEAVISALQIVCTSTLVVGGDGSDRRDLGDVRPARGPLGGIEALLSSGIDTDYLICPADIPLVTPELLWRLTEPVGGVATIFEVNGEPRSQSLPLRISTAALATVTAALDSGRNAVHEVLAQLEVDRIRITAEEAAVLININTPDDYASISGRQADDPRSPA